jgi:Protein of unknown function (DUF3159)
MTEAGEGADRGVDSRESRVDDIREQYRAQLLASIGGWSGTVIAAIPTVVFVAVNAFAGLRPAIFAAVGSAAVLTVYRLVRRQSVQQALSGLFGVVVAAAIAARTGHAKGYFLFGIWTSFAYGGAFVISILVRRPLVGLAWEFLDPTPLPDGQTWQRCRPLLRAYDLATLLAALIFLARGVVQFTLFRHNQTGWLAVARIAMGYPLYIAAVGFGFWIVSRARRRLRADQEPAVSQAAQTD